MQKIDELFDLTGKTAVITVPRMDWGYVPIWRCARARRAQRQIASFAALHQTC